MSNLLSNLTQAELLALAVDSSRRNEAGHALAYLKEAAGRADASARVLFMLGSEYAQLGMLQEAKASLSRAVELGPEFPLMRFQLGMLHANAQEIDAAKVAWQPLADLPPQHAQAYLATLRRGMLHLVAEEFDASIGALNAGIEQNKENERLNAEMRRIVEAIGGMQESRTSPVAVPPPIQAHVQRPAQVPSAEAEAEPGHLFISAYTQGGKPH